MGQRFAFPRRTLPALPALIAWCLLASLAMAQQTAVEGSDAAPAPVKAPAAQVAAEALPDVLILKDKNGKLQTLPGFTLEQFDALWKLRNQLDQQNLPPAYAIGELALSGRADASRATLQARFTLTVHAEGWVRVPLRLDDVVLVERAAYDGPGQHVLNFDAKGDGYVLWIRGAAGQTHTLTLKVMAPVNSIGSESHLRLSVPRVAVANLDLDVPLPRVRAKVIDGGTLESVKETSKDQSHLKMVGLGGPCDISWHAADALVADLPTVLEANGIVAMRITPQSISCDARLTVRSLGGEFDQFQVRLPAGASSVGAPQPGVTLTDAGADESQRRLLNVKLEKKTAGPIEVRLTTERSHQSPQHEEPIDLAGFEVPAAVRQWGTVTVAVEANWQAIWGETKHVRQIDDVAQTPRRDERTTGFEYFVQPYSLPVRVVPQLTRVRVEPQYAITVGSAQAELRAKFKYTVRGAKVRSLEIDMPGWEIDSLGPEKLVDVDAALSSLTQPFVVPLIQSTSGELEITLEAHRALSAPGDAVELELPRPRGEAIVPASVAVVPADNIELTVDTQRSVSLAPQAAGPQFQLPESQQDPLYFRTDGSSPKLVTGMKIHEQAISAAVTAQLEVHERETRVEQHFKFLVAYQPTEHLLLSVPTALRADRLSITLDGQKIAAVASTQRAEADAETATVRVPLPRARIGPVELVVSYLARHEKLSSIANTVVTIPLVMPAEGQLTSNQLNVVSKSGVAVRIPKGEWSEEPRTTAAADSPGIALTARRALSRVALALTSTERRTESVTTIQQAWIQTRLSDTQRQDRAVFRITSGEPRLMLALPPGADLTTLELEVDGQGVPPESIRQQEVSLALPGAARREHLLELRYHFAGRPAKGDLSLAPPTIKSAAWAQQAFWQLIAPATEHMLWGPQHFTPEYFWQWTGFYWNRQAVWDQRDLENWIGVSPAGDSLALNEESAQQYAARQQRISHATNQYLFSTVGAVEPLELTTVSRTRLVVWASLPLLAFGLLLIYAPAARHPAVLFVVVVLLMAAMLIDPEAALLMAQAASLGVVLCAAAIVLARLSIRPEPLSTAPTHGSSRVQMERNVTEIYQRPPVGELQASTTTNPFAPNLTEDAPQ